VKEKLTVVSTFFGSFPSNRIPEAAKDVNVRLFDELIMENILTLKYFCILPSNFENFLNYCAK
jgi:hypothetical protein